MGSSATLDKQDVRTERETREARKLCLGATKHNHVYHQYGDGCIFCGNGRVIDDKSLIIRMDLCNWWTTTDGEKAMSYQRVLTRILGKPETRHLRKYFTLDHPHRR